MDLHAVPSDPATTSLVSKSLAANWETLDKGDYSKNWKRNGVLLSSKGRMPIDKPAFIHQTENTHVRRLSWAGNIDVILTAQFFTNLPAAIHYSMPATGKWHWHWNAARMASRWYSGPWWQSWDGGWHRWLAIRSLLTNGTGKVPTMGRKVDTAVGCGEAVNTRTATLIQGPMPPLPTGQPRSVVADCQATSKGQRHKESKKLLLWSRQKWRQDKPKYNEKTRKAVVWMYGTRNNWRHLSINQASQDR